mmetsp:Transcript_6824/g.19218  ORF Transcript_6824/g.19218 Transcript_6824/m.19218 type:complete len:958 (+) Transcript_6824:136-3009(+)
MAETIRIMVKAAMLLMVLSTTCLAQTSGDLPFSHYTSGDLDGKAVVMLVESIGTVEQGWADSAAESLGGAALVVSEEIFSSDGNLDEELSAAVQSLGFSDPQPPVIGFGLGANHAVDLSYLAWPVSVAVTPDLSVPLPEKNVPMTEADVGAMLMIVSDVEANGPYVTDAEEKLVASGIHWETVRYGKTAPMFYNSNEASYEPEIWNRAWSTILSFLESAMSTTPFAGTEDPGSSLPAGVSAKTHEYSDEETSLQGYLAYPETVGNGVKLPSVMILPDWDHTNQYEISRANMLAKMGYIAFAADIFGLPVNTTVESQDERIQRISAFLGNPDSYVQRIRAAVNTVKMLPMINPDAIALTGYCFGGSGVVFDVMRDSALKLDVSFHGGLGMKPTMTTTPPMKPYLSYQSGGNDESAEDIAWLQSALTDMAGDWDITRYSQVEHGFTKWGAADSAYHERADGRSWKAMMDLLEEFLPLPPSNPTPVELSERYVAGSGSGSEALVVLLVDSISDVEQRWADSAVQALGGSALVLLASEVFPTEANMTAHLTMAIDSVEPFSGVSYPPVIGFGGAARHALLLSYDDWPVAVAVVPDLWQPLPSNNVDMTSMAEDDGGPILLLVSDVETNGLFVTDVEEELKAAGIHWESVRYGLTDHTFFHSSSDGYMPEVWARAWNVILTFLERATSAEGFSGTQVSWNGHALTVAAALGVSSCKSNPAALVRPTDWFYPIQDPGQILPDGVSSEMPFLYSDGDDALEGYLAYPSDAPTSGGKHSAVIVLPDWDHVNNYELARANMLAELGYVALAADIYGLPVNTSIPDMALRGSNATYWRSNPDLYVQRIRAAVESVKELQYVNSDSIGLIGYCFGGSGVVFDVFSDSSLKVWCAPHMQLYTNSCRSRCSFPPFPPYAALSLSFLSDRLRIRRFPNTAGRCELPWRTGRQTSAEICSFGSVPVIPVWWR